MDLPLYGKALWTYKWLLLVGVVAAVAAALFSGYRIQDGHLQSRSAASYSANTTVLLTNENSIFRAVEPGQAVQTGLSAPQQTDLGRVAQIYAYYATGDQIRADVQARIGALGSGDDLTALQRTAPPGADISTTGRDNLPVLTIIGKASSAARAQLISRQATASFEAYVTQRQDVAKIPAAQRIGLTVLSQQTAVAAKSSNPLVGVVVVGAGVLLIFVVVIFGLFNIRRRRAENAAAATASEVRRHESLDATDDLPAVRRGGLVDEAVDGHHS